MADSATDLVPDLHMSRDEHRRWAAAQPKGRFERIDSLVAAMAPERVSHTDRKALAWLALRRAVAAAGLPCDVYADGPTVGVDDNDFEPDAVLRCGELLPPEATVVPDPVVIVEVLSPTTRGGDLTRKLVPYFRRPSVRHYPIVWADRPQVVHHRHRDESPGIDTPMLTAGEIRLDPPGVSITVEQVYAGRPTA
jgi:Uma2 family endonuclease